LTNALAAFIGFTRSRARAGETSHCYFGTSSTLISSIEAPSRALRSIACLAVIGFSVFCGGPALVSVVVIVSFPAGGGGISPFPLGGGGAGFEFVVFVTGGVFVSPAGFTFSCFFEQPNNNTSSPHRHSASHVLFLIMRFTSSRLGITHYFGTPRLSISSAVPPDFNFCSAACLAVNGTVESLGGPVGSIVVESMLVSSEGNGISTVSFGVLTGVFVVTGFTSGFVNCLVSCFCLQPNNNTGSPHRHRISNVLILIMRLTSSKFGRNLIFVLAAHNSCRSIKI